MPAVPSPRTEPSPLGAYLDLVDAPDQRDRLRGLRAVELAARTEATALAARMRAAGVPLSEVSRLMGMTGPSVCQRIQRLHQPPGPHQRMWSDFLRDTAALAR